MTRYQNYIGGQWVDGPQWTPNRNPSDLADVIGEYAQADADQTKAAIAAATEGLPRLVDGIDSGARQHSRQGRHPTSSPGRTSSGGCCRARKARPCRKASAKPFAPATSSSSSRVKCCGCRARSRALGPAGRRRGNHARANRRGRADHAVELSDRDPGLEDRAGARVRQHRRLQAGAVDPCLRMDVDRDPRERRRPGGRLQPRHGLGLGRRRHDRHPSRRRGHQLHRIDGDRAVDREKSGRANGEVPARDGQQESARRARRCGSADGGERRGAGRLLLHGTALHGLIAVHRHRRHPRSLRRRADRSGSRRSRSTTP